MSAVSELSETDDGAFLRCCLYLRRYFRRMPAPAPYACRCRKFALYIRDRRTD